MPGGRGAGRDEPGRPPGPRPPPPRSGVPAMSRCLVAPAVLLAAAVGCAREPSPAGGADAAGGQPGAAYTIKFREKQAGDRYEVTYSGSSSVTTTAAGPTG